MFLNLTMLESATLNNIWFTDLSSCFENCSSLLSITVPDTSKVINWDKTFKNCSSIIQFPYFEMYSGYYFRSTYEGCTSLRWLDKLETREGRKFDYMFKDCINLECMAEIDTRNKDYDNIDIPGMFENCPKLSQPSPIVQDDLADRGPGNWFVNQYGCPSLRPTIPGNFEASSNRWDGVLCTWEKSERADFYRIFKDNDEYVGETSDGDTLEFLDTSCVEGIIYTYYCYAVRVETIDGQEVEYESEKSELNNGNIIIPEFDMNLDLTSGSTGNMREFKYRYNTFINTNRELEYGDPCTEVYVEVEVEDKE
jgi:hypothetical protein